jgi:DNA-directed RNA polymerase subunit RPC12/RpoP
MTLRRLAPTHCPHCGAEATLYIAHDTRVTCRLCGHKLPELAKDPAPVSPARRYNVSYGVTHPGPLDPWTRTIYNSGLDYVEKERIPEAVAAFRRALDNQRDFVDAHLWLARLLENPDAKRHHYGEVIAHIPNHLEAIRELMVLKGELTREEADRSWNNAEPSVQKPGAPVAVTVVELDCPVCGAGLAMGADGYAACDHCGYRSQPVSGKGYGMKSLTMEMLKRRGQAVQWQVGERLLLCADCGAATLLTPQTLTAVCPFCGGKSVLEKDALSSFVQPDGVVPFEIGEAQARAQLDEALNSVAERLKGMFINNRVARMLATSVYLPFWLFDVTVTVNKTIDDSRASLYDDRRRASAYRTETFADSIFDVPVCGAASPPHSLTERLRRYELGSLRPYRPDLLAGHTAELYTIDFERASLMVRQDISEAMRYRHGHSPSGDVRINVQSIVQGMQFRLVMLPVWLFTLTEQDGDVRIALVHGQQGHVVLGEARRPR